MTFPESLQLKLTERKAEHALRSLQYHSSNLIDFSSRADQTVGGSVG